MTSRKLLAFTLCSFPAAAWAYVDPGILGALYQMGYVAIFGILTVLIFRPWGYLKSKLRKLRGLDRPEVGEEPPSSDTAGPTIRQDGDAPG